MKLKKANIKDSVFFYSLRNDSENRKNFINSKKIDLTRHHVWFKKALVKDKMFKIIDNKNKDCGYIRLKKKLKIYFVSISIKKKFRKQNLAFKALIHIEKLLPFNSQFAAIVKKRNKSSKNLFNKAGYSIYSMNRNFLFMKKNKNKIKIIDQIESIRGKNNINWMNMLRLAYKNSPGEAALIMSKIYKDDSKISKLVKKLIK
jgi:hypothetical protein